MPSEIVTVTVNPCIDKTFTVDHVVPDRKLRGREVRLYPGGGGINVARVVKRLGGRVLALWSAGGIMGELLRTLLDDEKLDHEPLPIASSTRENIIVHEAASSQQFRFGTPGPELAPRELEHFRRAVAARTGAGYLVLSGSLPPGASAAWFAELIGEARGARVVVDTKGEPLRRAIERGVFLVKPNISELQELLGRALDREELVEEAARSIVSAGATEVVLLSLGRAGALLVSKEGSTHIPAPNVRAVSRVGAGDSMVGGVVWALAAGRSLIEAARFGVAAGTAAVLTKGTELCYPRDVERLHRCMPELERG